MDAIDIAVQDIAMAAVQEQGAKTDIGYHGTDLQNVLAFCKRVLADKQCVLLSKWQWWDLSMPEEILDLHWLADTKPVVIKAEAVIEDESTMTLIQKTVLTDKLVAFHPPCFFETQRFVYILIGPGTRRTLDHDVALLQQK